MPTVLACPACRTGLLARRGDPLCLTCIKASREMSSRPLWLFDSPLLRQALAQVDLPAVPAIVRAACGLSQRDLAAIVGWSPAALSYYERGVRDGMFDIRTALQFADAVGMPRAALLPLVCADPDAGLAAGAEDGTGMELSRRDFGGLAVAAGVAAVVPSVSVPRRVTSSHVRYWQACTDVLYARDRVVGGTVLLSSALQQWQRVRMALKDGAAGETGRQFLAVAGELALCTGWIALESGRMSLARPLYEEARELAADAGDVVLAVHVLTNQSMLYAEMARPARAGPARQARKITHTLPLPRFVTGHPDSTWERTYPGTDQQVGHVRAGLHWPLRDCPIVYDVILITSELIFPGFRSVSPQIDLGNFSYLPAGSSRRQGQDAGRQW